METLGEGVEEEATRKEAVTPMDMEIGGKTVEAGGAEPAPEEREKSRAPTTPPGFRPLELTELLGGTKEGEKKAETEFKAPREPALKGPEKGRLMSKDQTTSGPDMELPDAPPPVPASLEQLPRPGLGLTPTRETRDQFAARHQLMNETWDVTFLSTGGVRIEMLMQNLRGERQDPREGHSPWRPSLTRCTIGQASSEASGSRTTPCHRR